MTDSKRPTVTVGDWIPFYNDGRMVVGVVQYIGKQRHYPWDDEARTDVRPVPFDEILEVRGL